MGGHALMDFVDLVREHGLVRGVLAVQPFDQSCVGLLPA